MLLLPLLQCNSMPTRCNAMQCIQADLVLFLTSADRPFSESETQFIRQIQQWGKKVVFAVNKADILRRPEDLAKVVAFVRENAERLLGIHCPMVFTTSAAETLDAKLLLRAAAATAPAGACAGAGAGGGGGAGGGAAAAATATAAAAAAAVASKANQFLDLERCVRVAAHCASVCAEATAATTTRPPGPPGDVLSLSPRFVTKTAIATQCAAVRVWRWCRWW
jgi:hypothetical protein